MPDDMQPTLEVKHLISTNQTEQLQRYLLAHDDYAMQSQTALTLAAQNPEVEPATLACLLEHARDLDVNKTEKGKTALHYVVETGQTEKAMMLVQYGADLTIKFKHNGSDYTPVQWAGRKGHFDLALAIHAKKSASPDDPEGYDDLLLRLSRAQRWDEVSQLLADENVLLTRCFTAGDYAGYYPLHFLVLHNKTDLIIKYFKRTRCDANWQMNAEHSTALTLAAQNPEVEPATLACLLKHACDLDVNKKEKGKTALHYAFETGQTEKAMMLVQHGADLTIKFKHDGFCLTPVQWAGRKGHFDLALAINAKKSASPGDPEGYNSLLLHLSHAKRWDEVSQLLVDENVLLDRRFTAGTYVGYDPLHFFVLHNKTGLIVECFKRTGCNANWQMDAEHSAALTLAAQNPEVEPATLACLLKHACGLYVNKTEKGKTALHYAFETGQTEKAMMLVQHGADLTIKFKHNGSDYTPVQWAGRKGHFDLALAIHAKKPASPDDPEGYNDLLLRLSRAQRWDEVSQLLADENVLLNYHFTAETHAGYYPLHFLVLHNKTDLIIKYFKRTRCDAHWQMDAEHPTALTLAAQNPEVEPATLACLLKHACDLDVNKTEKGKTALHYAAEADQTKETTEKAMMLVQYGADLTIKFKHDGSDYTPVQWAGYKGHFDLALAIHAKKSASPGDPEGYNSLLLHLSHAQRWDEVSQLLTDENVSLNRCFTAGTHAGYHPLHFFVLHNKKDLIIKYFKRTRCDAHWQMDAEHPTALTLAAQNPEVEPATLACLLKHACDLDVNKTEKGKTALHYAAEADQTKETTEKAMMLVQHGADLTIQNNIGHTPFDSASFCENENFFDIARLQLYMLQNKDLTEVSLKGLWVLTREQLDYILEQKQSLANLGCILHTDVDVSGLKLSQAGLALHEVSVQQYTDMVFEHLPSDRELTVTKPNLLAHYPFDKHKKISELTNEEFIALSRWLHTLLLYFTENKMFLRIPANPVTCSNNTRSVIPIFPGQQSPKKISERSDDILTLNFV